MRILTMESSVYPICTEGQHCCSHDRQGRCVRGSLHGETRMCETTWEEMTEEVGRVEDRGIRVEVRACDCGLLHYECRCEACLDRDAQRSEAYASWQRHRRDEQDHADMVAAGRYYDVDAHYDAADRGEE